MAKITFKKEVERKLIHLSSLWMPLAIWFLPHGAAVVLFGVLLPLCFLGEVIRSGKSKFSKKFNNLFKSMLRDSEKNGKGVKITGATYVIVAALFCVIFFSREIAVTALAVMLVSDTAAALIGRKFGRHDMGEGKTLEGCAAFIVSGLAVVYLVGCLGGQPEQFYISGSIAVVMALIAEIYSRKFYIDDNLSIPLVVGIVMSVV